MACCTKARFNLVLVVVVSILLSISNCYGAILVEIDDSVKPFTVTTSKGKERSCAQVDGILYVGKIKNIDGVKYLNRIFKKKVIKFKKLFKKTGLVIYKIKKKKKKKLLKKMLALCQENLNQTKSESACGNGELEEGESCDDGNLENSDGCNSSCEVETQCSDKLDNDGDGHFDWPDDPECDSASDDNEALIDSAMSGCEFENINDIQADSFLGPYLDTTTNGIPIGEKL